MIVSPVLDDWEAYGALVERIGALEALHPYDIELIVVDDYSRTAPDIEALNARKGQLKSLTVIRLACNLGALRAIAAGLVAANKIADMDAVIVMDADGEDRPEDVVRLIDKWAEQPRRIVVAKRAERSEGAVFKLFYSIYKLLFRLLTGQTITFGSFSILPQAAVHALIHSSAIWNNLPAAIIRSRIPYTELETKRGARIAGRSRMNFMGLVIHGISAISVYADVLLLRVLIAMTVFGAIVFLGLIFVIVLKLTTDWAIPGWTSYVAASLTIILLQISLFSGLALFQLLSFRNLKGFVPAFDVDAFLLGSELNRDQRQVSDHGTVQSSRRIDT